MIMHKKIFHASILFFSMTLCHFAHGREQLRIVGSTAVYPFATTVAEYFGRTTDFKTPIVEATGTGGGINLFCGGIGAHYPDIVNASRPMTAKERARCARNGIHKISEVIFGYDGIVVGMNRKTPDMALSRTDLFLALTKEVKYWNEVNPRLPKKKILVLGPTTTLATREIFEELVIKAGCKMITKAPKQCSQIIREDGAFLEVAEHDNVVVQKLSINPDAIGIFSFSFLQQNRDKVKAIPIDGVLPKYSTIATGKYPISRPLYFYVKQSHIPLVPGIKEYVAEFLKPRTSGKYGYLVKKGLIPLPSTAAK